MPSADSSSDTCGDERNDRAQENFRRGASFCRRHRCSAWDAQFLLREPAFGDCAQLWTSQAVPVLQAGESGFDDRRMESKGEDMKRAAIYARVSTPDQHIENQFLDLRKLATQRGFEVSREYCDRGISGRKAKRPGLDSM